MEIPIVLIKTKLESKGSRNKPKEFSLKYWYPCKSDAKLSKRDSLMFVSNGFDVVVPCLPTQIAELKKSFDTFKDNLTEGLDLCMDIFEMTPNSGFKSAFKAIESSLLAAETLTKGTVITTGAADLTGISSQPAVMPLGKHQASCLRQQPSAPATESQTGEKRAHDDDREEATPTKKKVYTPLKELECHCGLESIDQDALECHVQGSHQNNVWKCSIATCDKVYDSAGSVRSHFRHKHSMQFRHYCNIEDCTFGHDEVSVLKKHKYEIHGIESDVMCTKCVHVFFQKNKLVEHLRICKSDDKPYAFTEEDCLKRYRAKRSLEKHMVNAHPKPRKDVPRKNCNVPGCGATYVWTDSLRLLTKNKHPGMKHIMPLIYVSEALTVYL